MRLTKPLLTHQALETLLQPKPNGLPDYAAYGRLIQHCADHRLPGPAKQLHAQLILSSVTLGNFLASKLITFYTKLNNFREAHKVFDEISYKTTFSFNALLIGYSTHNKHQEVLRLFSSFGSLSTFLKPDNFTITCVLKALTALFPEANLAKMMHCSVITTGFDWDIYVMNTLVTYYSRCEDIVSARSLFDGMPIRDIVSWNSILAGYSQGGFYDDCKRLYREMLSSKDVRPDGVSIVSIMQACAHSNDLILGMEVHRFVIENKIEMDLEVCNSLVALYAKCGSLDYARELFDEMSEKDEITYGAIISGYMVHGFIERAMDVFREVQTPGMSSWNAVISGLVQNNNYEGVVDLVREMQAFGFRPNDTTLSSFLPAISYYSNLKGAKEAHAYAIRNVYHSNIYVVTAIIDTYAKLGFLLGAERTFCQSRVRSVIVWTAIITAYATHGDVNAALSLFDEMVNDGTRPDSVTFTALLAACAHSGLVNEAWRIFNAMLPRYDIRPSVEQYACMVTVLSRAGKLSEAVEFISKMPIEPNAKVWGALLCGASVSGDVEVGKFACDHLFEIEPENTGNYVIMANLYSQARRWEEANKVRQKMDNIGLKKIRGSSWIEARGRLQGFELRDESNEETGKLCHLKRTA